VRLVAECGPLGDRHHNSGSARERRLAARGDPPGDNSETRTLRVSLAPGEGDCTARQSLQISPSGTSATPGVSATILAAWVAFMYDAILGSGDVMP